MLSCSSSVIGTEDSDVLQSLLQPRDSDFTINAPGNFSAKHTLVKLHRLQMQCCSETLARIWEGAINIGRHGISFLVRPSPNLFSCGVEVSYDDIALHRSGPTLCHRLSGPTQWAAMSLPLEDWAEIGIAMLGHDLTPPIDLPKVLAPAPALTRLRRIHDAVAQVAERAPEVIANADAARGLEAELIVAMVESLSGVSTQKSTVAMRHRTATLKRFRKFLDDNVEEPLYLPELCAALSMPGTTLRLYCHEWFGMGPKRYLHCRRLNLARRELHKAVPGTVTVTDIATKFGFWELGRFAVDYRTLFGESPSDTLRHACPSLSQDAMLGSPLLTSLPQR